MVAYRLVDKSLNVCRGDSVPNLPWILARLLPRETTALTATVQMGSRRRQAAVRATAVISREHCHNSAVSPRQTINNLSTSLGCVRNSSLMITGP